MKLKIIFLLAPLIFVSCAKKQIIRQQVNKKVVAAYTYHANEDNPYRVTQLVALKEHNPQLRATISLAATSPTITS